ncbi:MAG: YbhB/YbcL family Raf kinase inhibitor-like protein [Candidatus Levyibacteriota bacterium]
MKITSPAFSDNKKIPKKFSCDGENINPPLAFSDIPQNTKSLVLIVDDPDAPSGNFVHWIVFNIDPIVREVMENSVPKDGIDANTSRNIPGFVSPCPPAGIHRYIFKLYALDSILNLSSKVDKKIVEQAMQGHVIEKAELIGLYGRE